MTDNNENVQNQEEQIDYDALDNNEIMDTEQDSAELSEESEPRHQKGSGHLTKDQWIAEGRDPTKYKTKEEFDEFGKSYTVLKPHIDKFKQELKNKDLALKAVADGLEQIKRQEYLRGKAEVETRLAQAKEIGDMNAVQELTVQKVNLDQQERQNQSNKQQEEVNRVNARFMERESHWFNEQHPELKQKAIDEELRLAREHPELTYTQKIQRVTDYMHFEYPELREVKRSSADMVGNRSSAVNKSQMNNSSSETTLYRGLSRDDQEAFKGIKKLVEKTMPSVKYTVKEFLEQEKKYRRK